MIIYLITNTINGKRYVGQTITDLTHRWKQHLADTRRGRQSRLCSAIRKYGPEKFSLQILSVATTHEQLDFLEKNFIAELQTNDRTYGYNMANGGTEAVMTGRHHSEEARKKMSEARQGRAPWNVGLHHSEATRNKISAAAIGRKRSFTQEHCDNISKGTLGMKKSKQHRENMSKAGKLRPPNPGLLKSTRMLGRHHSEETKALKRRTWKNQYSESPLRGSNS
jgi:group I intron endonuclease